jgi:hypothetical protein
MVYFATAALFLRTLSAKPQGNPALVECFKHGCNALSATDAHRDQRVTAADAM